MKYNVRTRQGRVAGLDPRTGDVLLAGPGAQPKEFATAAQARKFILEHLPGSAMTVPAEGAPEPARGGVVRVRIPRPADKFKTDAQVHYHREDAAAGPDDLFRLDCALRTIGANEGRGAERALTRENVDSILRSHGLHTTVGGCHVAVHRSPARDGGPAGPRLALFTGNFGDWV